MNKTNDLARHGDLNFRRIEKLPDGLTPSKDEFNNGFILARGEHTGHKHVIVKDREETTLAYYIGSDGKFYLNITGGTATLTHEEHKPITFDEGVYQMGFEREYDYFQEEIKQVQD